MVRAVQQQRGFTLIEMVTVIVILGVLAVGLSRFLRFGSQIFLEASEREELIAGGRFAIERLNRDIRHALPNSPRLIAGGQCLEFRPIRAAASYLDIPVAPEEASDEISLIQFNRTEYRDDLSVAVYVLYDDEAYEPSDKLHNISSLDDTGNAWTLTLDSAHLFSEDSPTSRIYFVDTPVSYCVEANALFRYSGYNGYTAPGFPNAGRTLMAEFITASAFEINAASQNRNGQVLVQLTFSLNNEVVSFNNEIQVANVP